MRRNYCTLNDYEMQHNEEVGLFTKPSILGFSCKQHTLYERIKSAVKNTVYITDFKVYSVILNHLVRMHYIRPDLTAPGDFILVFVHFLVFFILLLFLELIKPVPICWPDALWRCFSLLSSNRK